MSRLRTMLAAARRRLRALTGLKPDQPWNPLRVAVYSFLGFTALIVLLAWLSGMPLTCVSIDACNR